MGAKEERRGGEARRGKRRARELVSSRPGGTQLRAGVERRCTYEDELESGDRLVDPSRVETERSRRAMECMGEGGRAVGRKRREGGGKTGQVESGIGFSQGWLAGLGDEVVQSAKMQRREPRRMGVGLRG